MSTTTGVAFGGGRTASVDERQVHDTRAKAMRAAAHIACSRQRAPAGRRGLGTSVSCSTIPFNASDTSYAFCHRSFGFLARHVMISRSSDAGARGWIERTGGGWWSRLAGNPFGAYAAGKAPPPG